MIEISISFLLLHYCMYMLRVNWQGKIIQTVCFILSLPVWPLMNTKIAWMLGYQQSILKKNSFQILIWSTLKTITKSVQFWAGLPNKEFQRFMCQRHSENYNVLKYDTRLFFVTERALIFHETINNSSWNVTLINIKTTKLIAPEGYSQAILFTKPPVLR